MIAALEAGHCAGAECDDVGSLSAGRQQRSQVPQERKVSYYQKIRIIRIEFVGNGRDITVRPQAFTRRAILFGPDRAGQNLRSLGRPQFSAVPDMFDTEIQRPDERGYGSPVCRKPDGG